MMKHLSLLRSVNAACPAGEISCHIMINGCTTQLHYIF